MTEKSTIRFIKEKVQEMHLREKMEFFQWLMHNILEHLKVSVEGDSEQHQGA
jgi:hypothetical protein